MAELDEEAGPKMLLEKIGKIDKIEERQAYHAKEIKEIKDALHNNELDGRITKVEKRQEFVLEHLKEINIEIKTIEKKCDTQRTSCMAAVAPLSLLTESKADLSRAMERFERLIREMKTEFVALYESSNKWNRWSLIMSMVACIVSCVSVLVSANVLLHLK